MSEQDWEAKIEKLLRKAEGTTSDHEAEAFTEMAERLMVKYGIDQAMIAARRAAAGGKLEEKVIEERIFFGGVYAAGLVMMAHYVCTSLGNLRTLKSRGFKESKKGEYLYVIGFESDVKQAVVLIHSLELQAFSATNRWVSAQDFTYHTASDKYNERRSFIVAFGRGAGDRIVRTRTEAVKEAEASSPGTELALVNRSQLVQDAYREMYPNTSKGRGFKTTHNGSTAGRAAGQNANTGGTAVGGSRRGLTR